MVLYLPDNQGPAAAKSYSVGVAQNQSVNADCVPQDLVQQDPGTSLAFSTPLTPLSLCGIRWGD